MTVNALTQHGVTVNALTVSEAIVSEVIVSEVIVSEVIVSEVIVTEVILTEMTGTVTEEAIVIAVVIRIRATATREAGPLLLPCSNSLSRHPPCVVGTTGTEIVAGMSGPGASFHAPSCLYF